MIEWKWQKNVTEITIHTWKKKKKRRKIITWSNCRSLQRK